MIYNVPFYVLMHREMFFFNRPATFHFDNSPVHSFWKVTKPLHETKAKVDLAQWK